MRRRNSLWARVLHVFCPSSQWLLRDRRLSIPPTSRKVLESEEFLPVLQQTGSSLHFFGGFTSLSSSQNFTDSTPAHSSLARSAPLTASSPSPRSPHLQPHSFQETPSPINSKRFIGDLTFKLTDSLHKLAASGAI